MCNLNLGFYKLVCDICLNIGFCLDPVTISIKKQFDQCKVLDIERLCGVVLAVVAASFKPAVF